MGKQRIRFSGQNFSCHKTHRFKLKLNCAAGSANNIELSMLVLDFMVKCRLSLFHGTARYAYGIFRNMLAHYFPERNNCL